MAKRTYTPERIINKLKEAEVLVKDRLQLKTAGRSEQASRPTTVDAEKYVDMRINAVKRLRLVEEVRIYRSNNQD